MTLGRPLATSTCDAVGRRTASARFGAATVVLLGWLVLVSLLAPAAATRAATAVTDGSQRWIVAVARQGGSAIGPRASAVSPLPRARAGRGDPGGHRAVARILREGRIRPTTMYRHAFDGFAATLSRAQVAALRRDPAVAVLVPDAATRVEAAPMSPAGDLVRTRLHRARTPTGIRRVHADRGALSRIDGVDDPLDVDVAVIDTGIAPSRELRVAGGYDCTSDDPEAWRDREGHGTHVAGTIAARDDGRGVVGVAPGARLWAIKIFHDDGSGLLSEELCGLDRVLGMRDADEPDLPRIEVVNLSIGQWLTAYDDRDCGRPSGDLVHGAVCALVAGGTTVVAAAGNQEVSTARRQPAAYDEVITVSALADFDGRPGGVGDQDATCPWYSRDADDTYADFSNFGRDVDLIAPGKCILSTVPDGWYAWSTGTSMATPHVTGAAALLAAAHPGARPSQIKAALIAGATLDWRTSTDPDGHPDPLLDVARLGALPDFSVGAAEPTDELAHGGVTRIDVSISRQGDHRAPIEVRLSGLPDGISADVAPDPTRGTRVSVWLEADADAPDGPLQVTLRATDGDLVRTTTATVIVRGAGPTVAFSSPSGGADGLRITDGDGITVAFREHAPGPAPAGRRVVQQEGAPVEPGTCRGVDWSAVGEPVAPNELDPTGSPADGWSYGADLAGDGCTRWLVRLTDDDGGSAWFSSPAVLRDTADPLPPQVTVTGDGAIRRGDTIWLRGGAGSVTLHAAGRDGGSGVVDHAWGDLPEATGWTVRPSPGLDTSAVTLSWTPAASATSIAVRAIDRTGRAGPARTLGLRLDGSDPRGSGWSEPSAGDHLVGSVPELAWRPIDDVGAGAARLQRVQRQTAMPTRGACRGASWADDGPSRLVAPHDEQWDLVSGRCYRWVLLPIDAVGNTGRRVVSGAVLVDLLAPRADFLTPDEGTVVTIDRSTYRVAWVERRQAGGGRIFRTLERERVRAVEGSCPRLGWVRSGTVDHGATPSRAAGLRPGWCYRWRLDTADDRDNVGVDLSGMVRVVGATS